MKKNKSILDNNVRDCIANDIINEIKNTLKTKSDIYVEDLNYEEITKRIICSSLSGDELKFENKECLDSKYIYALCVLNTIPQLMKKNGIKIKNLTIKGDLDLSFTEIIFPIIFKCCIFSNIILNDAKTRLVSFEGSKCAHINASRIFIDSSLYLNEILSTDGVELNDSNIKGNVILAGAEIRAIKNSSIYDGKSIILDRINIGGYLCLQRKDIECKFKSIGEFSIIGGKIGGSFICIDAIFKSNSEIKKTYALIANLIEIKGDFDLSKAESNGQILLMNMNICGELKFDGGNFSHKRERDDKDDKDDQYYHAISLDRSIIKGTVSLKKTKIKGQFRLIGVNIMNDLDCTDKCELLSSEFNDNHNEGLYTLMIIRSNICGNISLINSLSNGCVYIDSAKIGSTIDIANFNFELKQNSNNNHILKIETCTVGNSIQLQKNTINCNSIISFNRSRCFDFSHDFNEFYEKKITINMDRFLYEKFNKINNHSDRNKWIKMINDINIYESWQHLACVLSKQGDQEEAESILMELEKKKYKKKSKLELYKNILIEQTRYVRIKKSAQFLQNAFAKTLSIIFCISTGYGYKPWRSLIVALVFIILGTFIFMSGEPIPKKSNLTEKEKVAYEENHENLPDWYPNFSPCVFSIETFLPVGNLGVKDYWVIKRETFPYKYRFIHQIVGWIVSLLAAAGVTVYFIRNKP